MITLAIAVLIDLGHIDVIRIFLISPIWTGLVKMVGFKKKYILIKFKIFHRLLRVAYYYVIVEKMKIYNTFC